VPHCHDRVSGNPQGPQRRPARKLYATPHLQHEHSSSDPRPSRAARHKSPSASNVRELKRELNLVLTSVQHSGNSDEKETTSQSHYADCELSRPFSHLLCQASRSRTTHTIHRVGPIILWIGSFSKAATSLGRPRYCRTVGPESWPTSGPLITWPNPPNSEETPYHANRRRKPQA